MQQLFQEAEERASSAGNEPTPQITLDHVTVSFARSGGPGGQNVNKVNTKVDMRFNVKQAYWLSDRIRERIMQMVRKEKLGDRITALHQLVSPFGKKNGGVLLQEDDIVVSNVRIDLTRGRQNPLESINFFKDYESQEKFPIPHERISHLLPTSYQDMIVRVYSKKPELVAAVSEAFENFQLKIYGVKAQVHATPEKKKRRF